MNAITTPIGKMIVSLVVLMLAGDSIVNAQGFNPLQDRWSAMLIIGTCVVLLAVILFLAHMIIQMAKSNMPEHLQDEVKSEGLLPSLFNWEKIKERLTEAVPVEREEDILLQHEYDGIRELDNHLPPWWKWLFYVTIIWSAWYVLYYEFMGGPDQYDEFAEEMAIHEAAMVKLAEMVDENTVTALTDPADLQAGKEIYIKLCAVCHGQLGEGLVGPNLTDEYWIHGGGIQNIFKTIKYGVPAKGMIAWKSQLKPREIQQVASYVLTLQGTNPPNAKAPEGELWTGD